MKVLTILLLFTANTIAVPYINWGNCSDFPVFPNNLIVRGNSFGIMSKSGSVIDSSTNAPLLDFKTSCMAWAPADAVFTFPNTETVFARLNQQNMVLGDLIRLENCNGTVITILREQILTTLISLGFNLKYDIQTPQEVTYATTDSFHLGATSMTMTQNNEQVAQFLMPFGEKIKKMWLGEQDATMTFTSGSNQSLANGENRMIPVSLATYYLILASLERDNKGKIIPPLCNQMYRVGMILGICAGVAVAALIGYCIWNKYCR